MELTVFNAASISSDSHNAEQDSVQDLMHFPPYLLLAGQRVPLQPDSTGSHVFQVRQATAWQ